MIHLNDLPEHLSEELSAALRRDAASRSHSEMREPTKAPAQANGGQSEQSETAGRQTAVPPSEAQALLQQLSALQKELTGLNTAVAKLCEEHTDSKGMLEYLLQAQTADPPAQPESRKGSANRWVQGFGTAVILSPAIFGLGTLAARAIGWLSGNLGLPVNLQLGAMLCIAAGLLLLFLTGCGAAFRQLRKWLRADDWPEGDPETFLGPDPKKKPRKKPS